MAQIKPALIAYRYCGGARWHEPGAIVPPGSLSLRHKPYL